MRIDSVDSIVFAHDGAEEVGTNSLQFKVFYAVPSQVFETYSCDDRSVAAGWKESQSVNCAFKLKQ